MSEQTGNATLEAAAIDAEQIARLRTAVMRLARELRQGSSQEDLTSTQSSVLAYVVRRNDVTLGELAEAERLNPTMLSRIVNHLEEADYLQRQKDPIDRRSIHVQPTTQGRRVIQRMKDRRTQQLTKRLSLLNDVELVRLQQALPSLEALAGIEDPTP